MFLIYFAGAFLTALAIATVFWLILPDGINDELLGIAFTLSVAWPFTWLVLTTSAIAAVVVLVFFLPAYSAFAIVYRKLQPIQGDPQ